MSQRQYIVDVDVEAKKFAEWTLGRPDKDVDMSNNPLDMLDHTDSEGSVKLLEVWNRIGRQYPDAHPFMTGNLFAMRYVFHSMSMEEKKNEAPPIVALPPSQEEQS